MDPDRSTSDPAPRTPRGRSPSVSRTTIREVGEGFVVLDVAGLGHHRHPTPRWRGPGRPAVEAGSLTVRIEAVGPRTFRYRFALGTDVPAGDTPMLATDVPVLDGARCQQTGAGVSITTGAASIEVEVPEAGGPTLRVRRADGHLVGTIGGDESNLMRAWDSFPTGVCRTPVPGHRLATEVFSIGADECVYGFGEQFGRLDKVGQTIDVDMEEALGTITPRAYKNVPFWVTTARVGRVRQPRRPPHRLDRQPRRCPSSRWPWTTTGSTPSCSSATSARSSRAYTDLTGGRTCHRTGRSGSGSRRSPTPPPPRRSRSPSACAPRTCPSTCCTSTPTGSAGTGSATSSSTPTGSPTPPATSTPWRRWG